MKPLQKQSEKKYNFDKQNKIELKSFQWSAYPWIAALRMTYHIMNIFNFACEIQPA